MRILFATILFFVLLPAASWSQDDSEETVDWKTNPRLTWSDYKGRPEPNSDAAALTATYLGIEYDVSEKGFSWKIQCRFSKTRSWGKSKTEYILAHEQGHFDIAEIFARNLHKKLSEYTFNRNSYRKDLKNIYDEITSGKEAYQELYDRETDHSRKLTEQMRWAKKITESLKELNGFANY